MRFDKAYFNIGYLDSLSYKDTFVHRLDPRVKLLVSFIFIISVISFSKYDISGLIPFFIYPVFLIAAGDIPFETIAKRVAFVSPFAIFIGMFNPIIDNNVFFTIYGMHVTGGWISFLSILLKFVLTVSIALVLVATTSFAGLCEALERFKLPKIFVIQLLFLYRYLFVLLEETFRMVRAREARSFGKKGKDIKSFVRFISVLLIRTLERAERIYQAMLYRGFNGEIKLIRKYRLGINDLLFATFFIIIFYLLRKYNIVYILGGMVERIMR